MSRYYTFVSLLLFAALCAAVAGFCYRVDPYRMFNLDDVEPRFELFYYLRTTKAHQLEKGPGDFLVMGSSRTLQLRPTPPPDVAGTGFNASLPALTYFEMLHYLRHAAVFRKPSRLALAVEYPAALASYPRNQYGFDARRLARGPEDRGMLRSLRRHADDYRRALLTGAAVIASVHTAFDNYPDVATYFHDGTWPIDRGANVPGRLQFFARVYLDYYQLVRPAPDRYDLGYLRKVIRWCYRENIDTVLFISPEHFTTVYAYQQAGKFDSFLRWHTALLTLLQEEAQYAGREPFPLFGFQTDFAATAEPILETAVEEANFIDGVHFTYRYGDIIRDELAGVSSGRGTRLTSDTLPAYLDQVIAELPVFVEQNKVALSKVSWQIRQLENASAGASPRPANSE